METTTRLATRPSDTVPTDQELVQLVQSLPGGDSRRDAACEMFIGRYRSVVRSCALRYRGTPVPVEDLMQVGYVGLLKAINHFDTAIGDSLAAYAQPSVSGEIKRYFRDKRWQVHVRRPVQALRLDIRKATGELIQQLARSPRDGELARYLRVSEADVRDAQRADQAFQAYSLDARLPGADGSCSFADVFGDDDPQIQQIIDMESVRAHWGELPQREQRLLARALDYLRQRIMESAQPCAGR